MISAAIIVTYLLIGFFFTLSLGIYWLKIGEIKRSDILDGDFDTLLVLFGVMVGWPALAIILIGYLAVKLTGFILAFCFGFILSFDKKPDKDYRDCMK